MNIYVDFDDCLCETARYFADFAADFFGLNVPYEQIKYFNLQKSFSLDGISCNNLLFLFTNLLFSCRIKEEKRTAIFLS